MAVREIQKLLASMGVMSPSLIICEWRFNLLGSEIVSEEQTDLSPFFSA
jgi:hypothetical protein